jgi:hypothetical protein
VQTVELELTVMSVVSFALLVVKLWAFVDCILRPAPAFDAADKQTKAAWLWLTGLAFGLHLFFQMPYGFFNLIGTVAAFVYIVDVKPALSSVMRRR